MFTLKTIQSDRTMFRNKLIDDIVLQSHIKDIKNRKNDYNQKFVNYNKNSLSNLANRFTLRFEGKSPRSSVDSTDYQNQQFLNRIKSISTKSSASFKFFMSQKEQQQQPIKPSGRLSPIAYKIKTENKRITKENFNFFNKLVRVHSPLSKKKMDIHYNDFKVTRSRISKVKPFNLSINQNTLRRSGSSFNSFNLPSLHGFSSIKSFNKINLK